MGVVRSHCYETHPQWPRMEMALLIMGISQKNCAIGFVLGVAIIPSDGKRNIAE